MTQTEQWLLDILADPVTKAHKKFTQTNGIIDARVFLKNTNGFDNWACGQEEYEALSANSVATVEQERATIAEVLPVYQNYKLTGRVLDVGGGAGRLREFLAQDVQYVSTDPWLQAFSTLTEAEKEVYACLREPCNFVAACAEFQPFVSESFDWVHMRSMLDHVQVPDLALLEAHRVLKPGGELLVGMYVEGGKSGVITLERRVKDSVKSMLSMIGIDRWKDHHTWHPTYSNLKKLISDSGFKVVETYWQPAYVDTVCYVKATKI